MYKYLIYGSIIESELQLLNIPETDGTPEIRIVFTDTPADKAKLGESGIYTSPTYSVVGLTFGTVAVSNGNLMEIYRYKDVEPSEFVPFIIGWGFAFLFHQRGYTIFHCSAINIDGKAALVSGVSGAGKSTIALSLINRGYKYLVDDLAVFNPAEGENLVPAYPLQKVCRDVSVNLDQEELIHINEGRDKFAYHNETDFCDTPTPLKAIVLLDVDDIDDVKIEEISGLDKYLKVLSCMYLAELFAAFGTPEEDKYRCLKVAGQIKMLRVTRPRGKDTVEQITDAIAQFVKNA